jgi:hypothetical protein
LLLGQAIRLYLDDRRKAGRRPATLRSYGCHLRGFHRFALETRGQDVPIEQAAKLAGDYLAYRTDEKCCWDDNPHVATQDRHLSPASVAVTFRTLRAFFNRLQKLGYLDLEENPFALRLVDCPSTEDKIPSYLREGRSAGCGTRWRIPALLSGMSPCSFYCWTQERGSGKSCKRGCGTWIWRPALSG